MLALTMLLPDGVVQHIDIKEGAKVGTRGEEVQRARLWLARQEAPLGLAAQLP